ncbi:MAG: rubredoxin [Chloroflexota bacterium]|nr:rubredoxin [Chloroflexota bacterium]
MKRYQCNGCDYIYDPKIGDPGNNVESETPFEDLPDDWQCPQCGAKMTQFRLADPTCAD